MKAKRIIAYLTSAVILFSCEKDPSIHSYGDSLFDALQQLDQSNIDSSLFVITGDYPAFSEHRVKPKFHIFYHDNEGFNRVRCFVSDSTSYPDSLQFYRLLSEGPFKSEDSFLSDFEISPPKHQQWIRILAENDSGLTITKPIRIGRKNLSTEGMDEITVIGSPLRWTEFRWRGFDLASTLNHLFILEDATGREFCGVVVNTQKFIFYDLRNVDYNFNPTLFDPSLVKGESYTGKVYSLDEQGFILNYRAFQFTADSVTVTL